MTNREEQIYVAINSYYKKKGIKVTDILYSIVREMYLIEYLEIYKGKGGMNKVRAAKKDMTLDEVEGLLK